MHSLAFDIVILWVVAFVLICMFLMASTLSIQDRTTEITRYISLGIILIGAIVVTVGQLIGWIGVW